ncbi:hypothetical protein QTP88_028597 [Uroleucon formosanum]
MKKVLPSLKKFVKKTITELNFTDATFPLIIKIKKYIRYILTLQNLKYSQTCDQSFFLFLLNTVPPILKFRSTDTLLESGLLNCINVFFKVGVSIQN